MPSHSVPLPRGQLCGQERQPARRAPGSPVAASASSLAPHCLLPEPQCPATVRVAVLAGPEAAGSRFLCVDPVSRKNVKSAHSTRNRYSSQWTLTKCQASTPARTLTSDWRTVGSQHGVTVTESDSYSASLSQDTGEPGAPPVSCPCSSSSTTQLHLPFPHSYLPARGVQDTVSVVPSWLLTHCGAVTQTPDPSEPCLAGVSFCSPPNRENSLRGICWRKG